MGEAWNLEHEAERCRQEARDAASEKLRHSLIDLSRFYETLASQERVIEGQRRAYTQHVKTRLHRRSKQFG